jgi:hypothetical protein
MANMQNNNSEQERQKEIQHNNSFFLNDKIPKREYGGLRSTIGSP